DACTVQTPPTVIHATPLAGASERRRARRHGRVASLPNKSGDEGCWRRVEAICFWLELRLNIRIRFCTGTQQIPNRSRDYSSGLASCAADQKRKIASIANPPMQSPEKRWLGSR